MIELLLEDGGKAELKNLHGERVSLTSDRALSPGLRIAARIVWPEPAPTEAVVLHIKVRRSVREGARFAVEGRAFDLTRRLRLELLRQLAQPG